ncbi:unnamed protein product [Sphagnum jensenii]|uniref:Uncharacterized protein n=1 Tax=Sphagnum jensenii TaxID=128206 RepID=A0ABP1BY04_9BRYO
MITSQPNFQDQQSIDILLDASMVDASHGEIIAEEDDLRAKNVQLDLIGDKNEAQSNSEAIPVTQLVSVGTSIGRHADEVVQPNSIEMLVEYGTSGFTHEVGINTTRTGDVRDDFILALDCY